MYIYIFNIRKQKNIQSILLNILKYKYLDEFIFRYLLLCKNI